VTATDMARAAGALCRKLGVTRLVGVVGTGFGGMVALRLAALFPELVGSVAALGTTAALPDGLRRKMGSVRQQLDADRTFRHGEYAPNDPPVQALTRVRLGMLRELYSHDHLAHLHGDLFSAERALEAEAATFARSFDANCYALLCDAHARVDLYESLGRIRSRTLILTASSDPLAPPERARDTYHRLTAAGAPARYYELQSDAGHRAYELEGPKLGMVLREFLGR
jgi:homoserine O-acetyltransferase